jgi:ATP-dependent helicase/nuclease subunit A
MLDWIGPAAAAIEGTGDADRIKMTWHGEEEIAKWEPAISRRPTLSDAQLRLARLQPLDAPPKVDPDAKRIMDRLGFEYPHQRWTTVTAARSVGSLTKQEFEFASSSGQSRQSDGLPAPRCTLAEKTLSPTEIGSTTHLVLEHMDFSRLCDLDDIRRQVADQVEKKLLIEELAASVDVESIVWLLSTPLGGKLCRNASKLIRELPIYYPMDVATAAPSRDPLDRIMVRGKIDLLIPDQGGLIVVDFKTDQLTAQTVESRAELYRPQVTSYRDAIKKITGQNVKSALLVFLSARIIKEI